ncbi:hypothetical protein KAH94_03510, partial [bacterium]|nr:hypothetical protein [bacterium]
MKKILLLLLSLSLFNPIKTADCCTPCCYDCNSFIEEIIPNFPIEELVKQLTGESNSENYLYDDQTPNFILEQAQTNQNIPAQFINLLAGKKLVGWWRAKSIYKKIINKFLNDAIASKSLIDGLSQNLTTTNLKLIKKTITKHPHALKKFAVAASENIEAMPSSTLKFLLKKSFGDERKILEDALKKIAENTKPKSFFKLFLQQNALYLLHKNYSNYFKILIKKTKTQSEQHIQRYEKQLLKDDKVKQVIEKKEIQNFVTAIHKKEQEEQDKGRYTFVHAQQWHWHFTSDLFKKLWELQYKEIINDYHFLRFEAK